MKYFHRTSLPPSDVLRRSAAWFGAQLSPVDEGASRLRFGGAIGHLSVAATYEGHGTLVTVETDQPGESEIDRLAKRFLAQVHAAADPGYVVRGAY
jgi:hypothetical protein